MGKIDAWESSVLVEAMLVWTGRKTSAFPLRDDSLIIGRFGAKTAADLLPVLRSLEHDFYLSDARYTAADLQTMGGVSAEQFRAKHPDVADEVVEALAWCYTYDFK